MAKFCAVCGKNKVGALNTNYIQNGKLCNECLLKIGLKSKNYHNEKIIFPLFSNDIKNMINNGEKFDYKEKLKEIKNVKRQYKEDKKVEYEELLSDFKTKGIPKYNGLYFNNVDRKILIPKTLLLEFQLLNYEDLVSYTPTVRESTINKHHGVARAITGGAVFGGAGAIVGAATGRKSFAAVSKMSVLMNFKAGLTHTVNFINTDTKTNSLLFKAAEKNFSQFCALLDRILDENKSFESNEETVSIDGEDEQLRKLKSLLDDGVITQEDFDAKKKQILGI